MNELFDYLQNMPMDEFIAVVFGCLILLKFIFKD